MFMPVGTQGTVKGLEARELTEIGSQIVLANTYHLLLRPGAELVYKHGQLPGFTGYPGPFLTDSGGFQVMSLGDLRTITERGVTFRNHLNGDPLEMTPESSIQTQELLGADIIMAFDECPPHPATREYGQHSLERTARWLERCLKAKTRDDQALFAIVQGGVDQVLRARSLEATVPFNTPGFAIGGLAVGETKEEMYPMVNFSASRLPQTKPRYLMGVGHPDDLVASIGRGHVRLRLPDAHRTVRVRADGGRTHQPQQRLDARKPRASRGRLRLLRLPHAHARVHRTPDQSRRDARAKAAQPAQPATPAPTG